MDDLSAFGQLVKSIIPSAHSVAIFDAAGNLRWGSPASGPQDLRALALLLLALPADARRAGTMREFSGLPHYAYLVADRDGEPLGSLCFALDRPGSPAELAAPATLAPRITPLLTLLTRDLGRSRALATVQQRLDATAQMEWTLDAMQAAEPAGAGLDPIEGLLARILAKLDADVIVLNAPGFQFEEVRSAPACRLAGIEALREVASGKLLDLAQTRGEGLRVNKARTGQGAEAFRLVSVPLQHRNAAAGVLAVFSHFDRPALTAEDSTLLERLAPRVVELIEHRVDPATGLPTRVALEHYAPTADKSSRGGPRCVVYLDIDQMHVLNELFGFAAGDHVLRRVAALWPGGDLAEGGLIGRLSGDRFAAVLDRCTLNQGRAWAEATRQRIERLEFDPPCRGFRLSASFGVAVLDPGLRVEAAIALAATACRAAKDRGRNRVELFSDDDKSLLQRQDDLHLFRRLLTAIEGRQVRLLAQPIVSLRGSPRPTHYELLVRLLDERGAEIEPDTFLSAARRYQLLPRLDQVVVERALAELAPYARALDAHDAVCWINLSGPSIGQPDFADWVRTSIKSSKMPGHLLGFEITEGAAIENLDAAMRFITRVRELGCRVALDDFGTGFCSLAYLKTLSVNALKIDGGFVRDLMTDERSLALVSAVLEIARQLDLDTVAEYVESDLVAARLAELGVSYGQGYYFARPQLLGALLQPLFAATARPSAPLLSGVA